MGARWTRQRRDEKGKTIRGRRKVERRIQMIDGTITQKRGKVTKV
jgi:hypothetical protein